MPRPACVALFALGCGLLAASRLHGNPPAGPQKLPYKSAAGAELFLHVFKPKGHEADNRRPAIVFFFGGGWAWGNPSQLYAQCKYLASRGMVAISAEYRITETPSESLKDAKSAIRWVRRNARNLGIDAERIAAGGASAGGQLAAACGTATTIAEDTDDVAVSCRPAALVLFNPVIDNGPTGYGQHRVRKFWRAFSPLHNIDDKTPPTVAFFGTDDRHVPVQRARHYKQLMEAQGRRCDLHLYEGQKHGFFNYSPQNEFYTRTVIEMDRFLASLGFLVGEPTLREPNAKAEETSDAK